MEICTLPAVLLWRGTTCRRSGIPRAITAEQPGQLKDNAWSCCCDLPAPLPVGGQPQAGIEEFLNGMCFQCSCPSASLVTVKKRVPTCCIHGGSPVTSWLMQESGWSRWEELRITLSLVVERKSETGLLGQSSEPQLWNWECATTSPAS